MVRPSLSENNQPDCSEGRLVPVDTAPRQLSGSGSKHRLEVPAHRAADLEKKSTTNHQDSGRSVGRVSNPLALYRRGEPAPPACGILDQPCIRSTRALQARAELEGEVALAFGRTNASATTWALPTSCARLFLEDVSLNVSRQCCLNNLDCLSGDDGVGWIDDDLIVCLEARHNLYFISEVVPGSQGSQYNFPIFHHADT